jgi:hypothetical protein
MYIHHEICVAVGIGGRIGGNPAGGAPELANENLAFRRRKRADIVDQRSEQPVAERREIVRFPVVEGAGCEQGVERGLPGGVGLWTDHVGERLSERAKRRHCAFSV